MTTERIDIIIRADGSRVVRRDLLDIGNAAGSASSGVDALKNALKGLAVYASARALSDALDTYTAIQNRLKVTGLEAENLTEVYRRLLDMSNRTNNSLDGSVDLYARLSGVSGELSASTSEVLKFTEGVNKALAINSVGSAQASSAVLQLGQALGSTRIQAEEFNSIADAAPRILKAVANNIDTAGGSISRLKNLVKDGKVTNKDFFDAFMKDLPNLDREFSKTTSTMAASLVAVKNNYIALVGRVDEVYHLSVKAASAIKLIADNSEGIAKTLVSLFSGLVLIGGTATILKTLTVVAISLFSALNRNPFTSVAMSVTSATTALYLWRDQIKMAADSTVTLGDLFAVIGEDISAELDVLGVKTANFFAELSGRRDELIKAFDLNEVLINVARTMDRFSEMIAGTWRGLIAAVPIWSDQLVASMVGGIHSAMNSGMQSVIDKTNDLASYVYLEPFNIDLTGENEYEVNAKKLGVKAQLAFASGFQSVTTTEDLTKDWLERADAHSKIPKPKYIAPDLSKKPDRLALPNTLDEKEIKAKKKLKDELDRLVGSYDKVWGAQNRYMQAMELLDIAENKNLITKDRKKQVIQLINVAMKDDLDIKGAITRSMDEEIRLLGLTSKERQMSIDLTRIENELRQSGVELTNSELAGYREKLKAIQDLRMEQDLKAQIVGQDKPKVDDVAALVGKGKGDVSKFQGVEFLMGENSSLLEGTVDWEQNMMEKYQSVYSRIQELRSKDLVSASAANQMQMKLDAQLSEQRLSGATKLFSSLSSLSTSKNKELAAIGKAAAITQATIDGVLAVQKALASSPPPYNYALAAAIGVSAAANVAKIAGFAFGGDFTVGGAGGVDSQTVAFRATPGEKVSIRNGAQQRTEDKPPVVQNGVRIINVIDQGMIGDYLSGSDGERVILNMLRRNSDSVRQIANDR